MFDQNGVPPKVYEEIEDLFVKVAESKARINELGDLLTRYGLFSEYEERFFSLMNS